MDQVEEKMRRLRMRAKFILSALVLFLATGLLWAQFWKTYSDSDRKTIGEAYWLAGKQYETVGKVEKGSEYMAVAKAIYPQLDPAAITDESQPSAAELLAQGRATPIGGGTSATRTVRASAPAEAPPTVPVEVEETKAVIETFDGFLGALLKKDAEGASGYAGESVRFLKLNQTVTREELKTSLQGYFESADFPSETPSDVVDSDSIFVEQVTSPVDGVEGTVYVLNAKAKIDLSASLPIWSTYQRYYFSKDGNDWKIFALLL
jgi:hypothetical protein